MNVPAEHFSRPFRVGVAEDAFLYLPYRKGSAREGIGNCPIILKVQIVDELIAQSRATIERSDEPLENFLSHSVGSPADLTIDLSLNFTNLSSAFPTLSRPISEVSLITHSRRAAANQLEAGIDRRAAGGLVTPAFQSWQSPGQVSRAEDAQSPL